MINIAEKVTVNSTKQSKVLSTKIASNIKAGDILTFKGEIGSGKSFFCRQIIKFLCGVNTKVISPTFNILQTYEFKKRAIVYHYDLYRVQNIHELYELGFEEALSGSNIVLIEWPEVAHPMLINNFISIRIEIINYTTREIVLKQF